MIEEQLREAIAQAVSVVATTLGLDGEIPEPEIDRPRHERFGDFSTNVALVLASRLDDRTSRAVAEAIVEAMPESAAIQRVEIAGPGFINFFVTRNWLHATVREIAERGAEFGRAPSGDRSAQVEFVSANPTGPLHIGHARNMVLGDAIARLLEAAGWRVEREYYFNDAGRQMELFGASVEARYLQQLGRDSEVPEEGYHGAYLVDVAREIVEELGDSLADLAEDERRARLLDEGSRRVLESIRATLERFDVRFDVFFSERALHESGEIDEAIQRLREAGVAYERDGATWFRSTDFGDDKDRVLVRSNGRPTYFAADCAYLIDKFRRGFDHVVYVWGADHHGDVKRVQGAAQALGYDPAAVEIVVYQFVALYRGGEAVKMSKRAGDIVTLDELAGEVGTDATRFALLCQSAGQAIDFDIELVARQSMENPVYYVQYGHARIASILRTAAGRGVELRPIERVDLTLLQHPSELDLLRALEAVPEVVQGAAALRAPSRLTHAAQDLAARFHRFYTDCRVLTDDVELTQARLWLAWSTKSVIANVLGLLGVSAPESMERTDG